MHEWGIVEDAIKEIISLANKNNMREVNKIHLSLGEDDHLIDESVRLCFSCLAKDTIVEGAELEIKKAGTRGITIDSIEGTNE